MGSRRSESTRACRAVAVALVLAAPGCATDPSSPNHFGEGGETGDDGDDDSGDSESTTDPFDDDGGPSTATMPTSADDDDGDSTGSTGPDADTGSSTAGGETLGLEDTGTSGTSGATGDSGNDSFDDGSVHVEVEISEMWETGECDDITVTNVSDEDVTWEIELELPGTIYNLWNANIVEADGVGTFTGVDFNETIAPGASAMFGFCVNY